MPKKSKKFIDAYGLELWSYFKGGRLYEIIERDDGFIEAGAEGRNYFAEYKDWPSIQKRAVKYVKGRVLDIGCGAGRHSLYLQKKGHDVTGIDNSSLAIKICRLRGLKKAKLMGIEDIYKFKDNSFDTIIMLGNNFGLFGSAKKAKRLLKDFYRITSGGAKIVAETRDPYKTKNPAHLEYHKFNRKRGRMPGQLRIRVIFQKLKGPWFDYLMVKELELRDILKNTGWKIKRIIESKNVQYVAVIQKEQNG